MSAPKRRKPTLSPHPPKLRHRGKRRPKRDLYDRILSGGRGPGGLPLPVVIGAIFAVGLLAGVGIGMLSAPGEPDQAEAAIAQKAPVAAPESVVDGRRAADLAAAEPAKPPVATPQPPAPPVPPQVVYEEPDVLAAPPAVTQEAAKKQQPFADKPNPFADRKSTEARPGVRLQDLPEPTRKAVLAAQRAAGQTAAPPVAAADPAYDRVDWPPTATDRRDAPRVQDDPAYEPVAMPAFPPKPWAGPGLEPWKKNAVPVALKAGMPRIAIVIDDMGIDRVNTRKMIDLPGPMTMAFLTYAEDLRAQTIEARANGHELMVHMAMEPNNPDIDPGPDVLLTRWDEHRIRAKMEELLARFEGVVGLNNHMGSRFTADPYGMAVMLDVVRSKGLLFLDSRTSGKTVGPAIAEQYDIPWAGRHVFLDNEPDPDYVVAQLNSLARWAKQHGYAVGIGHPRDWTVKGLARWLPTAEAQGVQLVPISAIVRQRYEAASTDLAFRNQE